MSAARLSSIVSNSVSNRPIWLVETASETGTYYIAAGAFGRLGTYELEVRDVSPQTAQQETVNGPPVFDYQGYQIIFAENADGSTNRVSLGTVPATDPDDGPGRLQHRERQLLGPV